MRSEQIKQDTVSVIIPVYNEEGNIKALVERLHNVLFAKNISYELIFIDDRSHDKSIQLLRELAFQYPIRFFTKQGVQGKAQSLIEGFAEAKYEILAMIDGDLQYPPEVIPEMVEKIQEGAGVVVAQRTSHQESLKRKIVSRGFRLLFGKILHGLDCDVQSGLKVFKKEIIERVRINPTPWSFDLEFLTQARDGGYKIESVPITFEKRLKGETKVNVLKTSYEIGREAIFLKLKPPLPIPLHKTDKNHGKGFHFKGVKFVHHSPLHYTQSAIHTFYPYQILAFASILCLFTAALLINWIATITAFVAVVVFLYFFDLLFNLFLIIHSYIKSPDMNVSDEEIAALDERTLPTYTIFCPLYREWQVVPQFVEAIQKLDYPKNKLQVQLLLEEDDTVTIKKVREYQLPSYFEVIVVPHSLPKTKPKACNYGLQFATGHYSVIYDAEDMPDPLQLKKTVIAFEKSAANVACIQAKLNYYNPHQNLLTRMFTAEYSLWFDLVLTGLQSINAPIPLGGTSNHFKTNVLKELKGWDSFNVTEDCDLGMRLVKNGYNTAIVDSTTMEEANSDYKNWLNQRTRWIKGYMQTYLVHMRYPSQFKNNWREPHLFVFQVIVGGKIMSMFINPIMWSLTILYFAFRPIVGVTIEKFFPGPVLYLGVASLIFGNFLYLYYYMIGCAKRRQWALIKYVYVIPIYWVMMSIAAWKAVYQLFKKPHFWPKTIHGLHLEKQEESEKTAFIPRPSYRPSSVFFQKYIRRFRSRLNENKTWNANVLSASSFLVGSMMVANLLNFLFNAYLGRVLSFSDFGVLTLLNTLFTVSAVFTSGLSGTVNHRIAYLESKEKDNSGVVFFNNVLKRSILVSAAASLLWICAVPILSTFFRLNDIVPILLFTPILTLGFLGAVGRGYIQGTFAFVTLGLITIAESVMKFGIAIVLIEFHLNSYAYLPITLTSAFSFIIVTCAVLRHINFKAKSEKRYVTHFPKRFFIANTIAGLSTTIFLTLDVLLAKHYLSPDAAGAYAFLSLSGKMVYFFGNMLNVFIYPFVGRDEGSHQNTRKTFDRLLLGNTLLTLLIFVFVGVLGNFTLPILFGAKTASILPYIVPYALAITLFTISGVYLNYYIARHQYYVAVISLVLSLLMGVGIVIEHENILDIVKIILFVAIIRLVVMMLIHHNSDRMKFVASNLQDFFEAFFFKPRYAAEESVYKKILVFNWRDTRHRFAGGAEVYVHELSRRWVAQGHKVTLFCGNDGHCPRYEVIDGVEVVRRGGFYFVYAWAFLYYMLKFRNSYDIVIDCENGIPFFTPLYVKKKKYLVIHHIHQEVFRKSLHPVLAYIATFLEMKLMPLVYRKIQVITVSPSSKEEIMKMRRFKKEPVIIYNGIDLDFYTPGKKSAHPLIVYLGRLQYYKSLHVLIKAAQKVLEYYPQVEFVIAGEGEERHGLERLSARLGLSAQIKFVGRVDERQKRELYQKAWVFVNPSLMEGWGITTIEANACGTPVIASRVAGLKDSVKNPHTGYLVQYGDVDEFAEKIEILITNRRTRKSMSQEAIEWAQHFSWDKSAEKSLSVIT